MNVTLKQHEELVRILTSLNENIRRPTSDGIGQLDEKAEAEREKAFMANVKRLSDLATEINKQTPQDVKQLNAADPVARAEASKQAYLNAHIQRGVS